MPTTFNDRITRRQKIVYSATGLALLLFVSLFFSLGGWGSLAMIIAAYIAVNISLGTDLRREEWIVFPLYGMLVGTAAYTWLSQNISSLPQMIISAVVFALIMYGVLLTLNILNVATIRILPLERTAKTVLSMVGLVVSFALFYLTIINQPSLVNWVSSVGGITLLVSWPLIWTSMSEKQRLVRSFLWSFLASLVMVQMAALAGFWPISFMTSLFLAGILFTILGVLHLQEKKQLNQAIKTQYLFLGGVVTLMFYLITQW